MKYVDKLKVFERKPGVPPPAFEYQVNRKEWAETIEAGEKIPVRRRRKMRMLHKLHIIHLNLGFKDHQSISFTIY